jgi:DNA repair protein RAD50
MSERERQSVAQRTYENDLHTMTLRASNLTNEIRDKDTLEASIEAMKNEIVTCTARLKVAKGYHSDHTITEGPS